MGNTKKISRLGLAFFMSYLTNYGMLFGGSDFETKMGIFGFVLSFILYLFFFKFLFNYHDDLITKETKKFSKQENDVLKEINKNLHLVHLTLFFITSILIFFSYVVTDKYITKRILKINTITLTLALLFSLISIFIVYYSNVHKIKKESKNSFYFSSIFTMSFIFYIFISFIAVKLVVEFITIFVAVAGGAPFAPA